MTEPVRYFSERESPFPAPEQRYAVGQDGEPVFLPPDHRMWMSVEWAAERGIAVPENWRELS